MSPTFQLWFGALTISFAPVFVKWLGHLGATSLGFYRCALAALMLVPFAWRRPADWAPGAARRFWRLIALGGFVFALDLFVWHRAVLYAGAGIGTILGNTQVFYLGLLGILLFGEPIDLRFVGAVALAVTGILLLVSPTHGDRGPLYWQGVGYGLATGVVYAGYVLTLRSLEKLRIPTPLAFRLMVVSGCTAVWLAGIASVEGGIVLPRREDWPALLGLAGVVQIGGWFLITRNLPLVPVSRVGLLLLTQPLGATLWGALLFGERLGPSQLAGAGLTFVALYLGSTRELDREAPV